MVNTATISKKQKGVLDFISAYISKNGISPSMDEVRKGLKLKAVSTVHDHITSLQKKGYLSKDSGSSRSFIPKVKIATVVHIPLLGKIAAGIPIDVFEELQETIPISNPAIKNAKDYYALQVEGSSMVDEGIHDGDIVIIKKQSSAENGQTVVAIIDDEQTTLKKLYRENGGFRLQPRNQNVLPLFRKEVEIRGVVIQVIRNISDEPEKCSKRPIKHGFKTLDLFAGIGGIRIGFERAGFETVFSNDFEGKCKMTYDNNFSTSKLVVEDIRKIDVEDLPKFDFLLGGFPCQAFSIAGQRQGFKDERGRGNLFFDIAKILEKREPAGFLLENVKNLKSHDGGRTFTIIKEILEKKLGYYVKERVLNSMHYGNVPQNRERIYIVGFKNKDYYNQFSFPDPTPRTVEITDILEKNVPEKYYYNGKPLFAKLKKGVTKGGIVYQWRRQYVRANKSNVCPTLTANMGMGGHNVPIIKDRKGIRKLTPLECARLQGFPSSYKLPSNLPDSALYKQFGNSVTVTVIEAIAKQMMKAMK